MDTIKIDVSQTAWTDITDNSIQGLITNNSEHSLRYRIAVTQPLISDTFGHVLHPQAERGFDLDGGERVWALGFAHGARIALTKDFTGASLVNAEITFANSTALDSAGYLRTSQPFGISDNKNISSRNRNQWEEILSGVILEYTLIGGPFTAAEEIRGTGELLPIGTINTDNGVSSMNIDCDHNDFLVGMTITGQTSGATAVLTSTNTGSDIQHNYDHGSVNLTVGTGATDKAIRQQYKPNAYIPGKSQRNSNTARMAPPKENIVQRVGLYCDTDGPFAERTETEVAFVLRSSTSGTVSDAARFLQSNWNIDRFDGGASGGPNPSGITLDMDKVQFIYISYLWQGVGPVYYGFDIDNQLYLAHQVKTANVSLFPYMRTPSLPIRYEIFNAGVTASPTTMEEICSTVVSEGGYTLPGLEFSTPITWANQRTVSSRTPIIAIRLKNEFPAGKPNRRIVKYIDIGAFIRTNDCIIEIVHAHDPVDIVGATWTDIGGGSAVEYSTDIISLVGRPEHVIDQDAQEAGGGAAKGSSTILKGEFINLHSFLSQNFGSTNSQIFVVYASPRTGTADVLSHVTFIEFE